MSRLLRALVIAAAISVGAGGSAARAVTTPPTLTIEVIGAGQVTGSGISCGMGSLACYSSYGSSQAVTLTPTASSGWTFNHWEDGCTASPCSPTVAGNVTVTAVFTTTAAVQSETFGVALTVEGSGTSPTAHGAVTNGSLNYPIDCAQGTVTATQCSLSVVQGSTLTVVEQPDSGYFFSAWGGSCGGNGASCAVYVTGNAYVSADFVANTSNTLTVQVTGNGTVSGGGITCGAGSTCDAHQPPNSVVTLTATPGNGYALTGWGNACSGTQSTCTVQMDTARTVTATFAPLVQLTVTVSGNGTVSGGGISCGPGPQTCNAAETPNSSVTLTAAPSTGASVFWFGCSTSSGTSCTMTIGATPVSVTATFTGGTPPLNALTVTVHGDGAVTSATAGIYCTAAGGSECNANVTAGTSLTLTAVPASGTAGDFLGWSGDCSAFTSTTCTLTMNSSKTVGANFAGGSTTYQLGAQVVGSGSLSGAGLNCSASGGPICTGPQPASATLTITASPSLGATFTGWGGACSGTAATCTISMTTTKSVTATFSAGGGTSSERLAITIAGPGTVTTSGVSCTKSCSHDYTAGTLVALAAAPAKGAVFVGWSGACTGKKSACVVTMSAALSVKARFVPLLEPRLAPAVSGHRVTLSFTAHESGTLTVVEMRAGTRLAVRRSVIRAGGRKVAMTVPRPDRYVFTATLVGKLGKSSLRWTVRV